MKLWWKMQVKYNLPFIFCCCNNSGTFLYFLEEIWNRKLIYWTLPSWDLITIYSAQSIFTECRIFVFSVWLWCWFSTCNLDSETSGLVSKIVHDLYLLWKHSYRPRSMSWCLLPSQKHSFHFFNLYSLYSFFQVINHYLKLLK